MIDPWTGKEQVHRPGGTGDLFGGLAMKRFLFAVTRGNDLPSQSAWIISAPNRDIAERALIDQVFLPGHHKPAASLDGFNAANEGCDYKLSRLRAPTELQAELAEAAFV